MTVEITNEQYAILLNALGHALVAYKDQHDITKQQIEMSLEMVEKWRK